MEKYSGSPCTKAINEILQLSDEIISQDQKKQFAELSFVQDYGGEQICIAENNRIAERGYDFRRKASDRVKEFEEAFKEKSDLEVLEIIIKNYMNANHGTGGGSSKLDKVMQNQEQHIFDQAAKEVKDASTLFNGHKSALEKLKSFDRLQSQQNVIRLRSGLSNVENTYCINQKEKADSIASDLAKKTAQCQSTSEVMQIKQTEIKSLNDNLKKHKKHLMN